MCMCVRVESRGWEGSCSVILALVAKAAPTALCDVGARKLSYKPSQTQPMVMKISRQKSFNPSCHAPSQWYERHGCTSESIRATAWTHEETTRFVGSARAFSLITGRFE